MLSVLQAKSGELVGLNFNFSYCRELIELSMHMYEAAATNNHTDFAYEIDPDTGRICILHQLEGRIVGVQGNVDPELAPSLLRTLCDQDRSFQLDFSQTDFNIIENTHDLDHVGLIEVKDFEIIF